MKVLSKDKLEQLGVRMWAKFNSFSNERGQLELQWLNNLRQYKAIYDPEVNIPEGKSKVYPKDTHTKIVGWVAKMMEMMFPAQERNWDLAPTMFPNIAEDDLQSIIAALEAQQAIIAEESGNPPQEVTKEMIEKAVKEFAKQRSSRMAMECEDQLADDGIDYPEICKKVIRRAGIYGFGVAEGPLVRTQNERTYEKNPATGLHEAKTVGVKKPYYRSRKAWDIYPDLSAQSWSDQEGLFTREAMSRQGLRLLAKRDDFFGDVINEYLNDHASGNYKPRNFESELNIIKKTDQNQSAIESRRFEVIRWYGYVPSDDLKEVGVDVPASSAGKDILADVWMLGEVVIKADTAPFGEKVSDMFHAYIPEEDEDGPLTGSAKVEVLRDSQLKLCAVDRAIMDNVAESASSIKEVNDDLIDSSKRPGNIHGGMTIHRTGDGQDAGYPALRFYEVPNHTQPLLALRSNVVEVLDAESNLPAWRMGNAQPLGEAFRTSNNMSMMAGGGDMVTKDDVRAFDRFVKSFIGSLVRWNMEFNEKTDIKGDFQIQPKGIISLVAKEVRGAALDQLNQTLSPRDRVQIDERMLLLDRLKSRDLPTDYLLPEDEAKQKLQQFDQAQAAAAQVQQGLDESKTQLQLAGAQEKAAKAQEISETLQTKVQEGLSRIAQNMAKAKGVKDDAALRSIQLLLDQIQPEGQGRGAAEVPAGASEG
jgi:hypothetical protein